MPRQDNRAVRIVGIVNIDEMLIVGLSGLVIGIGYWLVSLIMYLIRKE
jgi:hypothetical protein